MRVIEVVEHINPNENNEPYVEPLVPKLRKVAGIYPMPVLEVLEYTTPCISCNFCHATCIPFYCMFYKHDGT